MPTTVQKPNRSTRIQLLSSATILLVIAIPGLVGWTTGRPGLFMPWHGVTGLHFATAAAVAAMALALWCLARGENMLATGLAAWPGSVGTYSLALLAGMPSPSWERVWGMLGGSVSSASLVQVAPLTAVALVLSAAALFLMANTLPGRLGAATVGMLAALIAGIGGLCLLNYLSGNPQALSWWGFSSMSPQAGLSFVVFGTCALLVARRSVLESSRSEPAWTSGAVFILGAIGAVGLHQSMRFGNEALVASMVQERADIYASELRASLEMRLKGLNRMAARWAEGYYETRRSWAFDAERHLDAYSDEFGLSLVRSDEEQAWSVGDPARLAAGAAERLAAMHRNDLILAVESSVGARRVAELRLGIDLEKALSNISKSTHLVGGLVVAPSAVAGREPKGRADDARFAGVDVAGLRFYVKVTPTQAYLAEKESRLPELTLFGGLLIAVLAGALMRSVGRNAAARRSAEDATGAIATEMLRRAEAERETADLYERAPCGYHSVGSNLVVRRMNDTELAWLGRSREEVVGKMTYDQLLSDESKQKAREAFRRFKRDGYIRDVELELVRGDGSLLPVSMSGTAIFDEQGRFVKSRTTVFDLSYRRAVERALEERQEQLDVALTGARVGLFTMDLDGDGFVLSPTGKAQLGFDSNEFEDGRAAWEQRIHVEDLARVREVLLAYRSHPWPNLELEFRARHKNGSFRNIMVRGNGRRKDEKNQLLGVMIDITHQRAAEQHFRNVLEAAPEAMVITDGSGKITFLNQQMERLVGYSRPELQGKDIDVLVAPALREWHEAARLVSAEPPTPRPVGSGRDLTVLRKDGTEVPVEIALSPASAAGVPMIIVAIRDISARKEAERQLREAKQAAEAANAAKSSFLAHMSHEIRTPLGIILGYAEMLAANGLGREETAAAIGYIRKSGESLLVLINDVLDLAKVEAGAVTIELRRFVLVPMLTEIMSAIGIKASEKGLAFGWSAEPGLPETIESDPDRLRQILFNLINNAIKFTDRGQIDVRIRQTSADHAGGAPLLEFLVADTGTGIRPESQEKLFQPFAQAEAYIRRIHGGTGLGLSLSRRLARQLGGDLRLVESHFGRGSTFSLTIDPGERVEAGVGAVLAKAAFGELPDGQPPGAQPLAGTHVLLVEDFLDNQVLIRAMLRSKGATVDVATDGRAGCDQALAKPYDVVLMDIQMPVMNGYEAIKELRARGYHGPVLALTAHAMKGEVERCLEAGFDHYLTKPVRANELVAAIGAFVAFSKDVVSAPEAERSRTRTSLSP